MLNVVGGTGPSGLIGSGTYPIPSIRWRRQVRRFDIMWQQIMDYSKRFSFLLMLIYHSFLDSDLWMCNKKGIVMGRKNRKLPVMKLFTYDER
jgi:hypothetical protein